MGAFLSGCESKLNRSKRDKGDQPLEYYDQSGTRWVVKPYTKSTTKTKRKNHETVKRMSHILLICGLARETLLYSARLPIKIEQRILLFVEPDFHHQGRTPLDEEQIAVYMQRMKKILVKNHDEGGIEAISYILSNFIYLGNDRDSANLELLQQLKISHVLNCAGLDICNEYPSHIEARVICAEDVDGFDIVTGFLDECFEFLDACRRNKGRILVHCMMGMNRSVTIIIAYLMYAYNMTLWKAVAFVAERRGWILQNESFRRQLIEYAHKIDRL
mmetsp:Transcript_28858/g.45667  ORF Transcript_28858/g.45667 Transcript_28858/m.45667 type:complete len:274 (+) Transcript_28858:36-857(+)